jgi:hypothetical protein
MTLDEVVPSAATLPLMVQAETQSDLGLLSGQLPAHHRRTSD